MSNLFATTSDGISAMEAEDGEIIYLVEARAMLLYRGAREFLMRKGIEHEGPRYKKELVFCKNNAQLLVHVLTRSWRHWKPPTEIDQQSEQFETIRREQERYIEENLQVLAAVTVCDVVDEIFKLIGPLLSAATDEEKRKYLAVPFNDFIKFGEMMSTVEMFYSAISLNIIEERAVSEYKKQPKSVGYKERTNTMIADTANELLMKGRHHYAIRSEGPRNGKIQMKKLANAIAVRLRTAGLSKPSARVIYKDYLPELIASGRVK